jgi:uncharacterized protein with von Willebrand factor type A (vWA) domain
LTGTAHREPEAPDPGSGRAFLANVVSFGRALRATGVRVTPGQVADAVRALAWVTVEDRDEVFRAMRAVLVNRHEDLALFETVFNRFWRHPEDALVRGRTRPPAPRDRRRSERFTIATYMAVDASADLEERDVGDRAGTYSAEERLRRRRFADMTDDELEATRRLLARMRWSASLRVTRRRVRDPRGPEIDLRRVLRHAGRLGAMPVRLPRRRRSEKQRPVVLLADVSGSMERYSRLVLHFFHAVVRSLGDVETFVFGTRLTRITPQLRLRNVDRALEEASREVADWAGGTRIGSCLGDFNRQWARRVLRRGAVVVVISDGCDRGDPEELAREMRHLQHRCHRLVWLNPHLGHPEYAPRVAGMRVALPFVDDFLAVDDVQALAAFSDALARLRRSGGHARPAHAAARRRGRSAAR